MRPFRPISLVEQVAAHLKAEILQGTIVNTMPGSQVLVKELGVHQSTAHKAICLLEKEGLIKSQGVGRRRVILSTENFVPPALRFAILLYEETDRADHVILELQSILQSVGHAVRVAPKTLQDLKMDANRVARFAKNEDVDAWIVLSGPRDVMEWFSAQPKPVFSLFGSRRDIPIASSGPDKLPAMMQALDRLVELGHRRIVMLVRKEHRQPKPALVVQTLLDAMEAHGLSTGPYNLPNWDNNPDDLQRCIDSLFRVTPPTALIIDESFLFNVVQQHIARLGVVAPRDISLVCADPNPTFSWHRPSIAHVSWDSSRVVQSVIRWANNVARGREDLRQFRTKGQFIEGGSIGPVGKRQES